jgi:hypothetical protein
VHPCSTRQSGQIAETSIHRPSGELSATAALSFEKKFLRVLFAEHQLQNSHNCWLYFGPHSTMTTISTRTSTPHRVPLRRPCHKKHCTWGTPQEGIHHAIAGASPWPSCGSQPASCQTGCGRTPCPRFAGDSVRAETTEYCKAEHPKHVTPHKKYNVGMGMAANYTS